MKRMNDFLSRLRQAWNLLTHRRHYFYVDFTDVKSTEETLCSAAFIAGMIWLNSHDPVSAKAHAEMLRALLCDCDTLMFYRTTEGEYRVAYACDSPETLGELRDLDFEPREEDKVQPENNEQHGTDKA